MGLWQSEKESNRQGFVGLWESSDALNPVIKIPLITSANAAIGNVSPTFTRNSTATYIDANGVLQTAAINVPRFQNGRYLVEPAATNILFYSELLTNSYWLKNNLSVVEDTTKGSFKLTNTVSGLCYIYSTNIVATNGVYYTQSAELEKGNTNFASLAFANALNPTLLPYAIFNLDLGTVSYTKDCVATITPLADNKFRCSITMLSNYGLGAPFGIITPSRDGAARITGVAGDYIYATKIQVEVGQQMTSYIPTTTAPLGRVPDVLHYDVSSVITQGQGSLYCEFWGGNAVGAIRVAFSLSDDTANNKVWLLIDTTGKVKLNIKLAGANVMYSTATSLSSTLNKVLIPYQDNLSKMYVNGVLIETDNICIIPTGLSKLHIGVSETGTYSLNSEVGNIKYFKEVLTEAEAIKITTI